MRGLGLRWGGGPAHGGSELFFDRVNVTVGTVPIGSMWAQNPIPREGGFPPHCSNPKMCAGNRPASSGDLLIVDRVLIPKGLAPGAYVLGWRCAHARIYYTIYPPGRPRVLLARKSVSESHLGLHRWDCEESNQV